jgi:5-methyltetrahydropteroyltriglutamate--homocysteine methyltransferase
LGRQVHGGEEGERIAVASLAKAAGARVILNAAPAGPVSPDLIALLAGKEVMVGVIDVASDDIETPEQVADTIGTALQFVARDKLIACTNCGLAPMRREVAEAKLAALVAGARLATERLARAAA